jgi:hypothetical protein
MATIISRDGTKIKIEVEVDISGSMFEMENKILNACNEVGLVATEQAIESFDTDGSEIKIGDVKYTVNTLSNKDYETPYGKIPIKRYLYQTSKGGKTYIPLEVNARIVNGATPRFAKILSSKYANMQGSGVLDDLQESHDRHVSLQYVQNVAEAVSVIADVKEELWEYSIPEIKNKITSIGISLDGAHVGMKNEGYRETMAGTISLYDKNGDRHHTIYIGASPEYGKAKFYQRLTQEIVKVKKLYPSCSYIGVADGSKGNWNFLQQHTTNQILDFYHATEYLSEASELFINVITRKNWLDDACHKLKHDEGGAFTILTNLKSLLKDPAKKFTKAVKEKLQSAITYFENNLLRMNYAHNTTLKLPIGSGVVEAACKTLIKQRCCNSGMRWKESGLKVVLSLRGLVRTKGRWSQFWSKINQYGVPAAV